MTAEQWNEMYPVGTSVQYQPIKDEAYEPPVRTRSEAWTLGSGHPIVKIEGRSGGVHIGHLRVCLDSQATEGGSVLARTRSNEQTSVAVSSENDTVQKR